MAAAALQLPEPEPWEQFVRDLRAGAARWRQGEHMTLIGPTGQGKTTMALAIAPIRRHVVIFGTKREDSTLRGLQRAGWRVVRQWREVRDDDDRVILWPRMTGLDDDGHQRAMFGQALRRIFEAGGWCAVLDDLAYLCRHLRLAPEVATLYNQARSMHVSLVGGAQRPRWVPLEALSQATHLFVWRTADGGDLKRVAELGIFSRSELEATIPHLPRYHALYLNTRTGDVRSVVAPDPRSRS